MKWPLLLYKSSIHGQFSTDMLSYWRVHYGSDGQTGLSEFGDLTINHALESCFRIKRVPSDTVLSVYFSSSFCIFRIRSQELRHCFNKCHHMSPLV